MIIPFISFRAQLSRVYISTTILACLFLISDLFQAYHDVDPFIGSVKQSAKSGCLTIESQMNDILDKPRQMVLDLNKYTNDIAANSLDRTFAALDTGLEILEQIVIFVLGAFKRFLRCLVEAIVDGGLALLKDNAKKVDDFLQGAANVVVDGLNWVINGIVEGINAVGTFFADTFRIFHNDRKLNGRVLPKFEKIPRWDIGQPLSDLLGGIDTNVIGNLNDKIDETASLPFQLAQDGLANIHSNVKINFTLFQIQTTREIQICGRESEDAVFAENDQGISVSWLDDIAEPLKKSIISGMILVGISCIIIIIANSLLIWHKSRIFEKKKKRYRLLGESLSSDAEFSTFIHETSRPIFTKWSKAISDKITNSKNSNISMRWFLDYISHGPAWIILFVGILGLIMCQMQYHAIDQVLNEQIPKSKTKIDNLVLESAKNVNTTLFEDIQRYVSESNMAINDTENSINQQVFGPILSTASSINDTITQALDIGKNFLAETLKLKVFGPVLDKLWNCLTYHVKKIERIIDAINKLKLNVPRIDESRFGINSEKLRRKVSNFKIFLFGREIHDRKTGRIIEYRGGKVGALVSRWRDRVDVNWNISLLTISFGLLLFLQASMLFAFNSFKSLEIKKGVAPCN